ncbi:DUF4292 domain-containing protein [Sungkyunkwania multivorans]|uniref:DUF4292 domain-containing protein n=1 Tax=Sungkyunkwania multivorans TaxID=1173618 RepID=A0ABW3CZV7_9FLAO
MKKHIDLFSSRILIFCGQLTILAMTIVLIAGCGANKAITAKGTLQPLTTKKIVKNHYKNQIDFTTITAKVKARYEDQRQSQSISVNLRMEKDEVIWLSASVLIPVAKVMITKDRVSFYEKVNKTFFDGDFSFLSEVVGTDLDFEKVQNLLLGQAIFDLRKERFDSDSDTKNYVLMPEKEMALFNRMFKLEPLHFKMSEQRLEQPEENRRVRVSYPSYQDIQGRILPKEILVESLDGSNMTRIEIDYRSVKFNEKLSFPFKIPKGYDEIAVK